MSEEILTGYQTLKTNEEDSPPSPKIVEHSSQKKSTRWSHIQNLDEFFTRVYQYHQRGGFLAMVIEDWMQLLQFAFIIGFSSFLLKCVKYDVLFHETKLLNGTEKVTLSDGVFSVEQCFERFDPLMIIVLIVAVVLALLKTCRNIYNSFQYYDMRNFYSQVLEITSQDLGSFTWHEIQSKLLLGQTEHHLCIHKHDLTQLDIYHRILRFKNYEVAMINKKVINLQFKLPFLGECVLFSNTLKYNLEIILFWGPWSPFENHWHLKSDYRNYHKRKELAAQYAELCKRDPSILGLRMWSLYSRLYLRHFNELEHEFMSRLNRAYKYSVRYMDSFTLPITVIFAKYTVFFCGSILIVFVVLTVIDEDILAVQHVIGTMTVLTIICSIGRACIPDENMVWSPEILMRSILSQIHYMPEHWKGQAHKFPVRDEFSQLFQYKFSYLLGELFSPITTPLVLIFSSRNKALDIVDFFRNFTVEVTGVGDVCSFAQMDIRKHASPEWMVSETSTEANDYRQAENGKAALSLIHFKYTNPEWVPPEDESKFLNSVRAHMTRDVAQLGLNPGAEAMFNSMRSSDGLPSISQPNLADDGVRVRGAHHIEGPLSNSLNSFASLGTIQKNPNEEQIEILTNEMNLSALYLHDIRRQKKKVQREPFISGISEQESLRTAMSHIREEPSETDWPSLKLPSSVQSGKELFRTSLTSSTRTIDEQKPLLQYDERDEDDIV
ncbi:DgyrCDS6067 [Dimorphilus gyrociliatus]|uniref:Autophagy-related protein 9 n=1 Tax=Dimorphilus gyrociliatus TaxID=2664684 RepID=A0A7I8VP86_9ANNE|nr:DgyrCDS6067 [Dimorphilus gyrociliatus]